MMGKAVKINITLPEDELDSFDEFVKAQGITRSRLILEALRLYIERAKETERERVKRLSMQRASASIRKLREKSGRWDGVAEIRKWRDAR
jgi:metal-responsive CopG/Arc/MetJ family transcriptional regulator